MKKTCSTILPFLAVFLLALLCGCAFDLVHVQRVSAAFTPIASHVQTFVLNQNVKVGIGTTYPVRLKKGTHWHQVGVSKYGDVFDTKDQIVTVEGSDVYEAQLIVSNQCITGFYLPVEKEVTPLSHPIPINIQTGNQP